jgi:hypothetical protein
MSVAIETTQTVTRKRVVQFLENAIRIIETLEVSVPEVKITKGEN